MILDTLSAISDSNDAVFVLQFENFTLQYCMIKYFESETPKYCV